MTASTTIVIPGRETQTIPGLVMTKSDVISAFAGDINLSGMDATETKEGDSVTITFANKTGTKGNDIIINAEVLNVNVEGDVVVNTRIEIPGRETLEIPGMVMTPSDVRAAFAGDVDLTGMTVNEETRDDFKVITFANKTGTKGTETLMSVIMAAVEQATAEQATAGSDPFNEVDSISATEAVSMVEAASIMEEEVDVALTSTRIIIPGREDQFIPGMLLDAQQVKDSFSGELDLSGYDVEEIESGSTLEVRFTARTGTKGKDQS